MNLAFQFGTEPFTGSKTTFDVSRWSGEVYWIDSLGVGGWEAQKKKKKKKWRRLLVNDTGNNGMNEILQAQSLL